MRPSCKVRNALLKLLAPLQNDLRLPVLFGPADPHRRALQSLTAAASTHEPYDARQVSGERICVQALKDLGLMIAQICGVPANIHRKRYVSQTD